MRQDYVIREAMNPDTPSLRELMHELSGAPISTDDMQNRLDMVRSSTSDSIFVFEQSGEVQGVLVFRIRENVREVSRYGEICIVVVRSDAKRRGIGKALMAFAENKARDLGCLGTYLISGFGRKDEAHRFYLELGYEITGYRFVKSLI
ncbi:GNAT family N-acetyltransferase [Cohnella panacarvi]|uniref:GNAT family N-acetyltransferase n=1 Tax=Cohnella panacarvi TaxID=400776 RepID=UPI000479A983|nr:GNAT family N-acetyltransferase [Cohnella panacarvi]